MKVLLHAKEQEEAGGCWDEFLRRRPALIRNDPRPAFEIRRALGHLARSPP